MLTSLNIAVNDYCNSRCSMCEIWKNDRTDFFDAESMYRFFKESSFDDVKDLSVTGGEPFLRPDLSKVVGAMVEHLPKLQKLFINTNGTYIKRIPQFIEDIAPTVPELIGCVSIEGKPEIHNFIRGIQGYERAVDALKAFTEAPYDNVSGVISTTITRFNEAPEHLAHVRDLARKFGAEYTFRPATTSAEYYQNESEDVWVPTEQATETMLEHIAAYKSDDIFLKHLTEWLTTGELELMGTPTNLACRAGEQFIFIDGKGIVRPCIYSSRSLGTVTDSYEPSSIEDLGAHEPCPCCTECTVYPMLCKD